MIFDINFPPASPLPGGEQPRTPSDEELDGLFARIGEQIARHPIFAAVRMGLAGVSAFAIGNKAVIEVLIEKGLLGFDAHEAVREAAAEMSAKSNKKTLRDFISYAARGLMRINGKPLAPDDAATLVSMFVEDNPDIGAALSTMTRNALSPEHVAAFFGKAGCSDDPLQALMDYRAHDDHDAKLAALSKKVEELSGAMLTMSLSQSRIADSEREARREVAQLRAKTEGLEEETSQLRTEVERLREAIATFRFAEG